jgi:hypothetical protein
VVPDPDLESGSSGKKTKELKKKYFEYFFTFFLFVSKNFLFVLPGLAWPEY